MPTPAPQLTQQPALQLKALGQLVRAQRKGLRISATATAEAAGMSRVTLHRIEKGEPSVTMGAYLNALTALGLQLVVQPTPTQNATLPTAFELPECIELGNYPQLQQLAWHVQAATTLTPSEAWNIYERNARHLDETALQPHEQQLLAALRHQFGEL